MEDEIDHAIYLVVAELRGRQFPELGNDIRLCRELRLAAAWRLDGLGLDIAVLEANLDTHLVAEARTERGLCAMPERQDFHLAGFVCKRLSWPTDVAIHFGLDFVRKYLLLYHDSHWEELLDNWHVQYLLLSKSAGEKDSLEMLESARQSPRWKTLYEDDVSALLEKN